MRTIQPMIATVTLLGLLVSGPAIAGDCEIEIEGDDRMQFNQDELVIDRSCEEITLTLVHTGELDVQAMGHNVVFTAAEDYDGLAEDAMEAADNDYVPEGDERVVLATDLIGGGDSTSLRFSPDAFSEDGDYVFFCSFPGHSAPMQGEVRFTN